MRYAIIGLGPVGLRIGREAARVGHKVIWYDPDESVSESLLSRVSSPRVAVANADRVIAAVPAKAAREVFEMVAPNLPSSALYEDWTSAIPEEKRQLGETGGEQYVDVTLLDSITAPQPLVCLGGARASLITSELQSFGFSPKIVGAFAGDAARVKMVRSAFMKPFEAITIELLRTAARWDPEGAAIASIARTLETGFGELATMLLETNRRHAARRADELAEVMASVGLESGRRLLESSQEYLSVLGSTWSREDAPDREATPGDLLAFLSTSDGDDGSGDRRPE